MQYLVSVIADTAGLGRRRRPELRQPDGRAPGPGRRCAGRDRQAEQAPAAHRHHRPAPQSSRQQPAQGGGHRQHPGIRHWALVMPPPRQGREAAHLHSHGEHYRTHVRISQPLVSQAFCQGPPCMPRSPRPNGSLIRASRSTWLPSPRNPAQSPRNRLAAGSLTTGVPESPRKKSGSGVGSGQGCS